MKLIFRKVYFIITFTLLSTYAMSQSLTFLALGDSYTIGESVEERLRWPVQLAQQLSNEEISIDDPVIVATTGWTTDELMNGIEEADLVEEYDIISLLIGVNNQYRGYPFSQYEKEFTELVEIAESKLSVGGTLFFVSIPDYGVTPFGQKKNPNQIAKELDRYNEYAKSVANDRGYLFFNITEVSRKAINDLSLVASDELHPSGKMYTQWVEVILPGIQNKLSTKR